jgi:hypothetical protein
MNLVPQLIPASDLDSVLHLHTHISWFSVQGSSERDALVRVWTTLVHAPSNVGRFQMFGLVTPRRWHWQPYFQELSCENMNHMIGVASVDTRMTNGATCICESSN